MRILSRKQKTEDRFHSDDEPYEDQPHAVKITPRESAFHPLRTSDLFYADPRFLAYLSKERVGPVIEAALVYAPCVQRLAP